MAAHPDQRIALEIGPLHLVYLRKRMVAIASEHEVIFQEGRKLHLGVGRAEHVNSKLRFAIRDAGKALDGRQVQNADANVGVQRVKFADDARHEVKCCRWHAGNCHRSAFLASGLRHLLQCRVKLGQ